MLNVREAQTTADITVLRDGRSVYEQAHTLNSADMVEVIEPWMGQHVTYEITVTARNPRVEVTFSTSDVEQLVDDWGENECFQVQFDIARGEIRTLFGAMNSCQPPSSRSVESGDRPAPRR
ncbi:hypothetical protein C5B90_11895 [Haloferax sp. Atlit-12N]|nr:hypothetical protein C5B90_11895 [Haloferax sp. Atlit-12N]